MINPCKYLSFFREGLKWRAEIRNFIKWNTQTSKRPYTYSNCYVLREDSTLSRSYITNIDMSTSIRILRIPLNNEMAFIPFSSEEDLQQKSDPLRSLEIHPN